MKSNWEKGEKLEVGILLAAAVFIGAILMVTVFAIWNPCNAADHAIVSFDDAEHLAALQDSVVGVRDTTKGAPVYKYTVCHSLKCKEVMLKNIAEWNAEFAHVDGDCDSPGGCYVGYYIYYPVITCRRLVGVTVTKEAGKLPVHSYPTDPPMYPKQELGRAIIFYEPYEEE